MQNKSEADVWGHPLQGNVKVVMKRGFKLCCRIR